MFIKRGKMGFKKSKLFLLALVLIISILFTLNFSSAFNIDAATPRYVNRTVISVLNFTINNTEANNITQVTIQLPAGATFYADSNGTDASNTFFSNTSTDLTWANTTSGGFIQNNSEAKNFWFNVSFTSAGDKTFTVVSNDTSLTGNQTTQTITVNFAFSGYVLNDTGSNESNVNVSIYQFAEGSIGPPSEILTSNVLTDANGSFTFPSINGSATNYVLKMVRYGPSVGCVSSNSSCNATKTGIVLPPFPAMLYYPAGGSDMSLNGSSFYLQDAATIRLYAYAYNSSNDLMQQLFGYEVIDQKVGFPVESNIKQNVSTKDVIVPAGKDYTVMFIREFSQFSSALECNGTIFNNTHCASPPLSNSSLGTLSAGQILTVNQSLMVTKYRLYGCINVASGHNNTLLNVTMLKLKLAPWTTSSGLFIPPIEADQGDINVSDEAQLNNSNVSGGVSCPSTSLAAYNISVLGSTSGISYLVEAYAKNGSNEAATHVGGNYLAAFQNLTITNHTNLNLTLYNLYGSYTNDSASGNSQKVNSSMMKINIQNESGGAVTTSMHVEVSIKNSNTGVGTLNYMIETLSNGTFYIPILNNSNWAEVAVFPNDGPPMTKKLNFSLNENNVTLISIEFAGDGDKGLRKMNASGQLEQINGTDMPIDLRFLRRGTNDLITEMNSSSFNPLKALVAGNIDLEIKVRATNVTMKFNNFDMFSAKQPPMFAVMDNNSLSSSTSQAWKFGNFVPKDVYDNVTLVIPYTSSIDETYSYSMSIPILYQEDQSTTHQLEVAWNISAGYTTSNLTDEFIDYNGTRYRDYLTTSGVSCSKTDSSSVCYMNTTGDYISMEIPHFSGLSPSISGTAPASSTSTSSSSSSSSVGGATNQTIKKKSHSWTKITPGAAAIMKNFDKEFGIKEIQIQVNNPAQNVKITVTKYSDKPADVSVEKTGKVYKYLHIEPKNLGNKLSKGIIKIQIEKSWLTSNSIEKDNVAMFKFNDVSENWEELTTVFKEEDSDNYYYDIELTSFSYFAIGEKIVEVVGEECVDNTDCAQGYECVNGKCKKKEGFEDEELKKEEKSWIWLWILIGIIVLIIIVAVVIIIRKQNE